MHGKNVMGSYADKLSYEERWQVIHYIRALQAQNKGLQYDENGNTLNKTDFIASTNKGVVAKMYRILHQLRIKSEKKIQSTNKLTKRMDQFIFKSKYKNILFAFMAVGIICMAWTWFTDDALHTRFWSNFLHNSMYFTGIALLHCCYGLWEY
jgi:hypothetical protein